MSLCTISGMTWKLWVEILSTIRLSVSCIYLARVIVTTSESPVSNLISLEVVLRLRFVRLGRVCQLETVRIGSVEVPVSAFLRRRLVL